MMKAARNVWGWTIPRPARLPMERTQRCAVRLSSRSPSWRCGIGPRSARRGRGRWSGHPGDQRDHCRLVPLPDDAQRSMAPVKAEILGIGGTGLAHPKSVRAQQGGQGGMVGVVALGREEEPAELAPVEAGPLLGYTLERRAYCAGFDEIRPSMWAKR
jgi:hypothetical protein